MHNATTGKGTSTMLQNWQFCISQRFAGDVLPPFEVVLPPFNMYGDRFNSTMHRAPQIMVAFGTFGFTMIPPQREGETLS